MERAVWSLAQDWWLHKFSDCPEKERPEIAGLNRKKSPAVAFEGTFLRLGNNGDQVADLDCTSALPNMGSVFDQLQGQDNHTRTGTGTAHLVIVADLMGETHPVGPKVGN